MRIAFEDIEWENRAPGMRVKSVEAGGKQIRLVEFLPEFVEPDWCLRGHSGYVLEGELHLNVNGETVIFRRGDGLAIPNGIPTRHRHMSGSPRSLLFLVEDL